MTQAIAAHRLTPDVIAAVGIAGALAWSIDGLSSDGGSTCLVPVVLATVGIVVARRVGAQAGVDNPYRSTPAWLTPLVLGVVAATAAVWWIVQDARSAAAAALSALLVAGPGALRLAAPAAMLVGARRGAVIGMAPSDPDTMRAARLVDTIILDQHGTVTTGDLSVTAVEPVDPEHLRNLRWFAGALEHHSDHPIGRAIARLSAPGRVTNIQHQAGLGISGSVDRHPVRVGRPSWIGIDHAEGLGTQVAVEVDGRALGCIRVAETARPDARGGVDRLRALGLDPVLMSDRSVADTSHLADQAGISTSHADVTVEQRLSLIQHLQADGRAVAMVGRHTRNAAALQAADLAISDAGEPAASGITLVDIDVQRVAGALALTQDTSSAVRANQRWAVAGMIAPLPFAAGGLIEPVLASLIALVCMLGVVARSSRIPRLQGPGA